MAAESMSFPETVDVFMKQYKIVDTEHVYTNGVELVPIFRMQQWFEHIPAADAQPMAKGIPFIVIETPWEQFAKDRYYHTKKYLCKNCKCTIKTELWDRERCFGSGTILKDNKVPNFCPNCGADMRSDINS